MKKFRNDFVITAWCVVLCMMMGTTAVATDHTTDQANHAVAGLSAADSLQRLQDGNARFVADRAVSHEIGDQRRHELVGGQHPFAIVLACADSRVPPELLFDQGLGDLFVIRVAGNVVDPAILGSIEYAVDHLGVQLVVVLGHDSCGGVQAVLDSQNSHHEEHNDANAADADHKNVDEGDEGTENLKETHTAIPQNLMLLARKIFVGESLPEDPHAAAAQAVRNNLKHQIETMMRNSNYLEAKTSSGTLHVVPAMYHIESGSVEWLHEVKPDEAEKLHHLGHDAVAD